MIDLADQNTWPKTGSMWRHTNANLYIVLMYTNVETEKQDKYPTTVIYQNVKNYRYYSRPLIDWSRSMTEILAEIK